MIKFSDLKENTFIVLQQDYYFVYSEGSKSIYDIVTQQYLQYASHTQKHSKSLILVEKYNNIDWLCFCGGTLLRFSMLRDDINKFTIYD